MTEQAFLETIRRHALVQTGDDVVVAFSGGADSVCLLDLLDRFQEELQISVRAAHLNHCLRGADADADEAFVRSFCATRDIPLTVERRDIGKLAALQKQGVELCAREERYEFLHSLGADKIATAHHANDQIETFLFRFARGCGLHGLCSIPMKNGSVIRPLLPFTRTEIEAYCTQRRLDYVTDATNLLPDYARNRIRLETVPSLRQVFPGFDRNAQRSIANLQTDEEYMRSVSEEAFAKGYDPVSHRLRLDLFREMHPAIRRRVLLLFCAQNGLRAIEEKHIAVLDKNLFVNGYSLTVPDGVQLKTDSSFLYITDSKTKTPRLSVPIDGDVDRRNRFFDTAVTVSFRQIGSLAEIPKGEAIDAEKLSGGLCLRSPQTGDRVTMRRRGCTKSLKKLYTEQKIPAAERTMIPVIADDRGVIWAKYAGADASRLPDSQTKIIMIIYAEDVKNE